MMEGGTLSAVDGSPEYFFSNKMGRIFLLAMEDVMGPNGVNAILNLARLQDRIGSLPPNNFDFEYPFDELGRLMQALEEMYGPRSGRNLAMRVGRSCFRLGIEDLGAVLGVADLAFRVLPLKVKVKVGFEVLIQMFEKFSDLVVRLDEGEDYFHWITERCSVCWGRSCTSPCCNLTVGILEEGLYWVSGGRNFYVEETSCIARGDSTCTILIGKQPLD